MITGIVEAGEAQVTLRVLGPGGQEKRIRAIIDTGYTGWLTLPSDLISELGLGWYKRDRGILADGSTLFFDVFEGTVVWDRRHRLIPVDEVDTQPLVGMALLNGYELKMQARHRGNLTIRPLP